MSGQIGSAALGRCGLRSFKHGLERLVEACGPVFFLTLAILFSPAASAQHSTADRDTYDAAMQLFRSLQYRQARSLFEEVQTRIPGAQKFIARCYMLETPPQFDTAIDVLNGYVSKRASDMEGWDYLAEAYARSKKVDEALAACDRQIHERGDYPKAWLTKAQLLIHSGRCELAEPVLTKYLAFLPDDPGALKGLGLCALRARSWKEGIEYLQKAKAQLHNDAEIPASLGGAYEKQGQMQEALGEYAEARNLNPRDLRSGLRLAACYAALKRQDERMAVLVDLVKQNGDRPDSAAEVSEAVDSIYEIYASTGKLTDAMRTLQSLAADLPANRAIMERRGDIAAAMGNSDDAFGFYSKCVGPNERNARISFKRGDIYWRMKNIPEASKEYYTACQTSPGDARSCSAYARALIEMNQLDAADAVLQPLRSRGQLSKDLRLSVARLDLAKGRLDEADRAAGELLREDPLAADALLLLAKISTRQSRSDEAIERYQAYRKLQPADKTAMEELAVLYLDRQRWAELRRLGPEYLDKWPSSATMRLFLAFACQQAGDMDAANRYYEQALANPQGLAASELAWAQSDYGVILFKEGKYAEARDHFLAALQADSGQQDALRNLTLALVKLNDLDRAAETLRRLQELDSSQAQDLAAYVAGRLKRKKQ